LFNCDDHITKAHVAECEGAEDIQRTALSLLAANEVAAAVEAWNLDKLVYRSERPERPATSVA